MSRQQEFRRYAEQCTRMIESGEVPARHRDAIERMAQAWLQLAAEEERIAEFEKVIDQLLMRDVGGLRTKAEHRPTELWWRLAHRRPDHARNQQGQR